MWCSWLAAPTREWGRVADGVHCSPARSLAEQIAQIFAEAKKNGTSFAFLTVDLDHFKEANDLFGHVIGDVAIARRLKHAADDAFLARMGSDEFTLILATGNRPKAAQALANRLLNAVAKPFEVRGHQIPIGLSVGGTIYPQDATDINSLIANADAACSAPKPMAATW